MARESKFKRGMEVKCLINPLETYIVIEVLRNELLVRELNGSIKFSCKKSLFEVIEK